MTAHHSPLSVRLLVTRMLVLAVAVTAVFLLLTSADAGAPPAPETTHMVGEGETLWELAGSVAEEGSDLREMVRDIQEINGLDGTTIHPGQVLSLPAG